MPRERSSIEVFFQALGHPALQKALREIAVDADSLNKELDGLGRSRNLNLGSQVRKDLRRAAKDQSFLNKEVERLQRLGAQGLISDNEVSTIRRLRSEWSEVGRQIGIAKSRGVDILDDGEQRDVSRLREEWRRLGTRIRDIKNQSQDFSLTGGLEADINSASKAYRELAGDVRRFQRITGNGFVNREDRAHLQELREEYIRISGIVSRLSSNRINLGDADAIRSVNRLRRRLSDLRGEISSSEVRASGLNNALAFVNSGRSRAALNSIAFAARGVDRAFIGAFRASLLFSRAGIGALGSVVSSSSGVLSSVVRNVGGLAPAFRLASASARGFSFVMQRARAVAFSLAISIGGLVGSISNLVGANAQLEGTILALRALNGEIDRTGRNPIFTPNSSGDGLIDISNRARETAKNFEFLNKVANEHGTRISDSSKEYQKLSAAIKGTTTTGGELNLLFDGLADANLVIGGTSDNFNRATTALQQIASKGTVSAEELRGQLGEAIPGAIGIAARAFGTIPRTFLDNVARGAVDSGEFIRRFGIQLQKEYGEAAESLAGTTRIAIGRLANAWFNARVLVGNGALDRVVGRTVGLLTELINTLGRTGALTRFGASIANILTPLVDRFERAVRGGFDFERVLNGLVVVFRSIIRLGEGSFDLFISLGNSARTLLEIFRGYGLELPRIDSLLRSVGVSVSKFINAVQTGQPTDNSIINFLASASAAAREFFHLMLSSIDGNGAVNKFNSGIERATALLTQLAHAFFLIRTGEPALGIDETGFSFAESIQNSIDKMRVLSERFREIRSDIEKATPAIKDFFTVLTDSQAPVGGDGNARANGIAFNLRELFTGGQEQNLDTQNFQYEEQLSVFFVMRDTLARIGEFLVENKESLAAFLEGGLAVAQLLLDVIGGITSGLKAIGSNGDLAFIVGAIFAFTRIPFAVKGVGAIFSAISARSAIASASIGTLGANATMTGGSLASVGSNATKAGGRIAGLGNNLKGFVNSLGGVVAGMAAVSFTYDRFSEQIEGGRRSIDSFVLGARASINELFGDNDEAASLRKRQNAADRDVDNLARLDAQADFFERTGNRDFEKFLEQGFNPIQAARKVEELSLSLSDQKNGRFRSLSDVAERGGLDDADRAIRSNDSDIAKGLEETSDVNRVVAETIRESSKNNADLNKSNNDLSNSIQQLLSQISGSKANQDINSAASLSSIFENSRRLASQIQESETSASFGQKPEDNFVIGKNSVGNVTIYFENGKSVELLDTQYEANKYLYEEIAAKNRPSRPAAYNGTR